MIVMLLQGATAFTTDTESWERLALEHSGNAAPTKIIFFELDDQPLNHTENFEKLDNGYSVGEYDLALIGQYLQDNDSAPEPYATFYQVWTGGVESRLKTSKGHTTKNASGGF